MKKQGRLLLLFVAIICALSVVADAAQNDPKTAFKTIEDNFNRIRDYKADVYMTIKGMQINVNKMPMTIYYKKPNKLKVDAKDGMAVAPQGLFDRAPGTGFIREANPKYLRTEKCREMNCWLFSATDPSGMQVNIWVDIKRVVVVATETVGQIKLRSEWDYTKVGNIHVPSEIRAQMSAPRVSRPHRGMNITPNAGTMSATVQFKKYQLNKGIPDSVFVENKKGAKRPF